LRQGAGQEFRGYVSRFRSGRSTPSSWDRTSSSRPRHAKSSTTTRNACSRTAIAGSGRSRRTSRSTHPIDEPAKQSVAIAAVKRGHQELERSTPKDGAAALKGFSQYCHAVWSLSERNYAGGMRSIAIRAESPCTLAENKRALDRFLLSHHGFSGRH